MNTQTHKYINAQTCVYVCFYAFVLLCFCVIFAIYCLVKERQRTRAKHESLTRDAYYCGAATESLGTGT